MSTIEKKVIKFVEMVEERAIISGKTSYFVTETFNNGVINKYNILELIAIYDSECLFCLDGEGFLEDNLLLKNISIGYIDGVRFKKRCVNLDLKGGQTITVKWE